MNPETRKKIYIQKNSYYASKQFNKYVDIVD